MKTLFALLLVFSSFASAEGLSDPQSAIKRYFDNFNNRDKQALVNGADSPFVFVISGTVKRFDNYGDAVDFDGLEASGWAYSRIHENKLIYADDRTAMVAVSFSRYDAGDEPIATSDVVYLLVQDSGSWKLKGGFISENLTLGND